MSGKYCSAVFMGHDSSVSGKYCSAAFRIQEPREDNLPPLDWATNQLHNRIIGNTKLQSNIVSQDWSASALRNFEVTPLPSKSSNLTLHCTVQETVMDTTTENTSNPSQSCNPTLHCTVQGTTVMNTKK